MVTPSDGLLVLGVDPGLADTGYAVLEAAVGAPRVLGTGVVHTRAGTALEIRLEQLFEGTRAVLDRFGPDLVVIEDLFSAPSVPHATPLCPKLSPRR